MKIFILKLLSLLVLILGLVSLTIALGVPEVQTYLSQVPDLLADLQTKLPEQLAFLNGALTVQGLWFGGSVVAIVLGAYGFWPKGKTFRRRKKIAYEGPHGEVQIQLDTVEQSLNHVLARMPEIKKIDLRVDPQAGGRKALIHADVVIYQQPGQSARAIAALVSDYIAETATKLLGLEELATIELNVTGISVNTRKSSKAIRKESLSHSANAPVELLEAAPAPLTLSGPGEPLGSESIEEELEEEAESAMETSAIDTKRDEANQAAARSELLEPLSVGEPAPVPEHVTEAEPVEEAEETSEEGVAPLDMDVLDETLEDSAEEEADEEIADEASESEASDADADDDESEVAEAVEEAEESEVAESAEEAPAAPVYPWESGATAEESAEPDASAAEADDEADLVSEEATAEVPDMDDAFHSTDSVMGDIVDDVTIPEPSESSEPVEADESAEPSDDVTSEEAVSEEGETGDEDNAEASAESTDKKRWGSWFN